jgi:hypothetical protein
MLARWGTSNAPKEYATTTLLDIYPQSVTVADISLDEITFDAGEHWLAETSLEDKRIHLKEGARVYLGKFTDIRDSYIQVDETAYFIIKSPYVALMGNIIFGSSTDPIIVADADDEKSEKATVAFNRFDYFNQHMIDAVHYEKNLVKSWEFVK